MTYRLAIAAKIAPTGSPKRGSRSVGVTKKVNTEMRTEINKPMNSLKNKPLP